MVRRHTISETNPPDLVPPPEPPDISVCAHDDNSVCGSRSDSQRGTCDEQLQEAQGCLKKEQSDEKKPENMRTVQHSLPSKPTPEPSGKKSIVKDCSSYDSGAVDANYEDRQPNVERSDENQRETCHQLQRETCHHLQRETCHHLQRETCHQLQRKTCHQLQRESSQFQRESSQPQRESSSQFQRESPQFQRQSRHQFQQSSNF